jgi:alpha-N-arabinofuranosidase
MNRLTVHLGCAGGTISRHLYGHFAEHIGRCIYDGMWVGEESPVENIRGWRKDIVDALARLNIPNIRWPGGCFAETYHWRDGIGPRESRPTIYGESNAVGTHEFMDLCEILECDAYLCGNMGSGTVQEMRNWLDYMTGYGPSPMAELRKANGRDEPWNCVKFWCFGNESMGCGGTMRPEYFADVFRHFQTYMGGVYKVACGPNHENYEWTDTLMKIAGKQMDGLAMHYYTIPGPWADKGDAIEFDDGDWFLTMKKCWFTEELVREHSAVMDRYDPEKRVQIIADEWGTWFNRPEGASICYQQNTLRDAMVAAMTFNIFHNHCDRVFMANIAQVVNILQAMILTEPGHGRMLTTPTYHVFEMFNVHQDATFVPVTLETDRYAFDVTTIDQDTPAGRGEYGKDGGLPAIHASASIDSAKVLHISLCNIDPNTPRELTINLDGLADATVTGRILTDTDANAHNTFDEPARVTPTEFDIPAPADTMLTVSLPPKSIVVLAVTGGHEVAAHEDMRGSARPIDPAHGCPLGDPDDH